MPELFFLLFIFSIIIYLITVKKKLFIDQIQYSPHKVFLNKSQNIPLIGGFFLFLGIIFLLNVDYIFILLFFGFFILGACSDVNILLKPTTRFYLQALILLIFFILMDIKIFSTRINYLDFLLENQIFNIFFCIFCVMILVNGYNFIDGLNGLSLGYFIIIILNLIFINDQLSIKSIFINNNYFLIWLFYIIVLIFLSKIFLGDAGSYLLGIVSGLQIINVNYYNPQISPYFLILLIWYPCFEVLFSMIRKKINKKSPLMPDNMHLHHLVYIYLNTKFLNKYINSISSLIILFYNFTILFLSTKYIYDSLICILIILLNLITYMILYFVLLKNFNKIC